MPADGAAILSDEVLLDVQRALQGEADEVAADLNVEPRLAPLGQVVRVGSAALGLMVWRDLDLTVVCDHLDLPRVVEAGADLAGHPRVREVVFRNDTGCWNRDPAYPDGLYLGVRYRSASAQDWKLDIWFVDEPDRQPDLRHLREFPPRLDADRRRAILRIKSVWASRPEYGRTVRSFDIYTAVLDHDVRDPAAFEAWITQGTS